MEFEIIDTIVTRIQEEGKTRISCGHGCEELPREGGWVGKEMEILWPMCGEISCKQATLLKL